MHSKLPRVMSESESDARWLLEAQRAEQGQPFPVWTCDRCLRDTVTNPDEVFCDPCKEKSRRSTNGE